MSNLENFEKSKPKKTGETTKIEGKEFISVSENKEMDELNNGYKDALKEDLQESIQNLQDNGEKIDEKELEKNFIEIKKDLFELTKIKFSPEDENELKLLELLQSQRKLSKKEKKQLSDLNYKKEILSSDSFKMFVECYGPMIKMAEKAENPEDFLTAMKELRDRANAVFGNDKAKILFKEYDEKAKELDKKGLSEEEKKAIIDGLSLIVEFIPIAGPIKVLVEGLTGKTLSGEKLKMSQRLWNVGEGLVFGALDIMAVGALLKATKLAKIAGQGTKIARLINKAKNLAKLEKIKSFPRMLVRASRMLKLLGVSKKTYLVIAKIGLWVRKHKQLCMLMDKLFVAAKAAKLKRVGEIFKKWGWETRDNKKPASIKENLPNSKIDNINKQADKNDVDSKPNGHDTDINIENVPSSTSEVSDENIDDLGMIA